MAVQDGLFNAAKRVCMNELTEESMNRLTRWVERQQYRAYDPGDGQMSFLRHLTFGSRPLERALTAAVLRSPFNIRPLLGIQPHASTKGMGYMAWGYLRRFQATGFTTRAGRIPQGEPTIVWSSLIGQAFVDAFHVLDDPRYLEAANSICDWILKLPRERTPTGTCLSYVAFDQVSIHNSNMLGSALLARVGALTKRGEAIDVARQAMRYSCERQNPNGSWFYGEAKKYHWIDSFHTGYNLDSLKRYIDSTKDSDFAGQMLRGYEYLKQNFFE